MHEKTDSQLIETRLKELGTASFLAPSQQWWPRYLFHFSDVTNVAQILNNGCLYSRSYLQKESANHKDIASPEVLSKTKVKWKEFVRLYFRPRTPMQYSIEGIRPNDKLEHGGAHCPVPVFLLFKSKDILCDVKTQFSNGNLASWGSTTGDSGEFFSNLPFENIYHAGSLHELGWWDKRSVVRCRQAEVLVPEKLNLESLHAICCRSTAELETLFSLISIGTYQKWKDKISVATRGQLFFERWPFVKRVYLKDNTLVLVSNRSSEGNGPFQARLAIREVDSTFEQIEERPNLEIVEKLSLTLNRRIFNPIEVKLTLNGHLAYLNEISRDQGEIPF